MATKMLMFYFLAFYSVHRQDIKNESLVLLFWWFHYSKTKETMAILILHAKSGGANSYYSNLYESENVVFDA